MNALRQDATRATAPSENDRLSMRPESGDSTSASIAQAAAADRSERDIPRQMARQWSRFGVRTFIRFLLLLRSTRFRSLVLTVMAFAVTAGTISVAARTLKGPPQIEVLSEKLQDYAANRDRYSVLFLGTSRIYRTIVPDAVDAAMREAGCQETSYNFGVEGMFSVERDYVLNKILSERPQSLKMIVTEDVLSSIGKANDASYLSDRVRFFYDLEHLPIFLDSLLSYPESTFETIRRLVFLAVGYLREYSGVSQLAGLLPNPAPDPVRIYDTAFQKNRGYLALKAETDASFERRRRSFVESERWIVRERQERDLRGEFAAHSRAEQRGAHLAQRVARIAESGVKPVVLVLPQERPETTVQAINAVISKRVETAVILDYNRITQYPELFERELWFDAYHFTAAGARLASTMIGRDLCRVMKQ